jgi:hypothetical protein
MDNHFNLIKQHSSHLLPARAVQLQPGHQLQPAHHLPTLPYLECKMYGQARQCTSLLRTTQCAPKSKKNLSSKLMI